MKQLNFLNTIDTMSNNDEKLKIESGYVKENRGKTAIKRKEISKPLKELLKRGSLEGNKTILDNGCGFGIDFNYLKQLNYEAYGFDKFQEKFNQNDFLLNNTYDVVLSTFVINTIDDKKEIEEYIKQAFAMTNKKLIISVRMDKKAVKENWIQLEDGGYITSLKTYQKFYTKESIKKLIENTLHIRLNKENCLQFGETTIINKECL